MKESGLSPSSSSPAPILPKPLHRRRRRPLLLLLLLLSLLLLLAAVILILFLTLLQPHDPRTQLVSATFTSASPHLSFPTLSLSLNLTVAFDILVYNPNRVSFSHGDGSTRLLYRSAYFADAVVLPGRIPARGSAHVQLSLTVDGSRLARETAKLLLDAMAGEFDFTAETRIPGRVKLLGFIKHHAVAMSHCLVTVGFPDLKVRRQDCTNKTKL